RGEANRGPAWTALRADERSKRAPACGGEVVGLRLVEEVNDRLALLEEAGYRLATCQREHAEVDLAPETASAPEVAIGEGSGHGQREGKQTRPQRTEETPDDPGLEAPAQRNGDDAREQPCRRIVRLLASRPAREPAGQEVRRGVDERAIREDRQAEGGFPGAFDPPMRTSPFEPGAHCEVAHLVGGQQRTVPRHLSA